MFASFAMFAHDQIAGASKHQVTEVAAGPPASPGGAASSTATTSGGATAADPHPGAVRRFIDDASNTLTSPFRSVFRSSSQWAARVFALVCALLIYGLGLGYLARYASGVA